MAPEAHYRQVLQISQEMLTAGKAEEWDRLISLEEVRSSLLQQSLTPALAKGKSNQSAAEIILQIQAIDAELQEIVATWLEHARILLRIKPVATL